jgi:hypothetical protein
MTQHISELDQDLNQLAKRLDYLEVSGFGKFC